MDFCVTATLPALPEGCAACSKWETRGWILERGVKGGWNGWSESCWSSSDLFTNIHPPFAWCRWHPTGIRDTQTAPLSSSTSLSFTFSLKSSICYLAAKPKHISPHGPRTLKTPFPLRFTFHKTLLPRTTCRWSYNNGISSFLVFVRSYQR